MVSLINYDSPYNEEERSYGDYVLCAFKKNPGASSCLNSEGEVFCFVLVLPVSSSRWVGWEWVFV